MAEYFAGCIESIDLIAETIFQTEIYAIQI